MIVIMLVNDISVLKYDSKFVCECYSRFKIIQMLVNVIPVLL
jgi:hypothetical protein